MTEQKFLLATTPTTTHRVEVGGDRVVVRQELHFEFQPADLPMLIHVLQEVKKDHATRHSYFNLNETYAYEYEPEAASLLEFTIRHIATGRTINMALSTAYKLLDALQGKTGRLVKEDL